MKMKNLKLFGLALSGVLSVTCLTGCEDNQKYYEEKGCEFSRQFDIGEHIISVPLENDISEKPKQIETYPGYEVVGISTSAYGQSVYHYGGGAIIYSNVVVVECITSLYEENGEYVYLNFGTPLDYEGKMVFYNDGAREFDVGEHIISIPIVDDAINENVQYEYHEGYEILGITVSAYGKSISHYGSGSVIYKNIVPVKAEYQEDGYTSFGEPIVSEKEKTLN